MSNSIRKAAPPSILAKANDILVRAKKAHDLHQFTHAFQLYGHAFAMLGCEWNRTHTPEIGKRLVFAYREGSYPAFRKFTTRSTPNRAWWGRCALERSKQASDLEVDLLGRGVLHTEEERIEVIRNLKTLSVQLAEQAKFDYALHYISQTYDTWRRYGEGKPLDGLLRRVLKYYEAECLLHSGDSPGAYLRALVCVDESFAQDGPADTLQSAAEQLRKQILSKLPAEWQRQRRYRPCATAGNN